MINTINAVWSSRRRSSQTKVHTTRLAGGRIITPIRCARPLNHVILRAERLPARSSEQEILSELEDVQPGGIAGYGVISSKPSTPLLDTIQFPSHLKGLSTDQLKQVAKELRADLIYNVSQTGGHLGSSLGVVELTVALNYVFDQPQDKII